MPSRPRRLAWPAECAFLPLLVASAGSTAWAVDAPRRRFDLPAGTAVVTLKRAALQAGLEIVYSAAVVDGVQTQAVAGEFTPREALEQTVANTPLRILPDPQTGSSASCAARTRNCAPNFHHHLPNILPPP